MKYKANYWSLFAPMIKKSIEKRYSKELVEKVIQNGKPEYKGVLSREDEFGKGHHKKPCSKHGFHFA